MRLILTLCAVSIALATAIPAAQAGCTMRNIGTTLKTRCDDGSSYTIRKYGGKTKFSGDEKGEARQVAMDNYRYSGAYEGEVYPYNHDAHPYIIDGRHYQENEGGAARALGRITGSVIRDDKPRTTIILRD